MTAAKVRSVSEQQTVRQAAKLSRVSIGRIAQADTVLEHAPDLVAGVMAGSPGLDAALSMSRGLDG
jgi:ABC-type transporter Mla subunit MlaD